MRCSHQATCVCTRVQGCWRYVMQILGREVLGRSHLKQSSTIPDLDAPDEAAFRNFERNFSNCGSSACAGTPAALRKLYNASKPVPVTHASLAALPTQVSRQAEVLAIQPKTFALFLCLGKGVSSTPANNAPKARKAAAALSKPCFQRSAFCQ